MLLKPFVINRHGRLVFPCNFFPELDFSVFESPKQFAAVIRRDFGEKAPTETDIVSRLQDGTYQNRYEICRDLALNLFWANRYMFTMYEKRPTRWADLPRQREDIFLPLFKPRDATAIITAIQAGCEALPARWDDEQEDKIFHILLNVFRNKPSAGGELRAIKPTVAEILANPSNLTYRLLNYDRDYLRYTYDDVIDCIHPVPELEALMRQGMILHNQYPWDPASGSRAKVGELRDDDYVVAYYPRNNEVLQFLRRLKEDEYTSRPRLKLSRFELPETLALSEPIKPYPPVRVSESFRVLPRIEAISVYEGEIPCTNADLISNHAYCWSRMTAEEIAAKTGIERRAYTELTLEQMSLLAAHQALAKSGRKPEEIGAVLFCSCTSTRLIPSVACWLSGELGLAQTHNSSDITAACAGMPYGLSEAIRLLQEIERPVLLVCAEKFSDKIGTVRTSRMIFGDGAAAVIIAPAPEGADSDVEIVQTFASGPWSEVNSIIWPNPEFDNNITVYGPEVKALARRYLVQMMGELKTLPHPNGGDGCLMDAVDIVVPHQANKTMVADLSKAAGVSEDKLYFNIERVGNTSSASILLAVHDAVREGRIDRPMRVFAPGFGAGAVGGYAVMRIDPAVVAINSQEANTVMANLENNASNGHTGHNGWGSLKGRVALVTGASRGIGRAIAIELACRGANIALDYRSDSVHAESAAAEIREMGVECVLIKGDISQKGEAQRVVKEVLDKWHRLDILVNNAGITRDRTMRKMTDDDWAQVINVNLNGTFYCTSAALPAMINQRFGRIINIASVVGQMGAFGQANYSASKGGIIAFTKTLALEMAKFNITANSIAPGFTSTEMVDAIPEEISSSIKAKIPLGRFATPEEIARAAAFLAADADYMTGQELNINGGYHM